MSYSLLKIVLLSKLIDYIEFEKHGYEKMEKRLILKK